MWYVAGTDLSSFHHVLADRNDTTVPDQYRRYLDSTWYRVAQSLNTSRFDTFRDKLLYNVLLYPIVVYNAGGRRGEFAGVFEMLRAGTLSLGDVSADELDIVLRSGVAEGGVDALTFVMDDYYVPVLNLTGPGSPDSLFPFSVYQLLVSTNSDTQQSRSPPALRHTSVADPSCCVL